MNDPDIQLVEDPSMVTKRIGKPTRAAILASENLDLTHHFEQEDSIVFDTDNKRQIVPEITDSILKRAVE